MLFNLALIGQVGSFIAVQLYRYRRVSSPVQRQQSKWVVFGLSVGWGGYLLLLNLKLVFPTIYLTSPLVNVIAGTALYGFILLIPSFLGLAIVRSRLWDIDILINRTLVYGILSVCVVGVYVLVVGYLGSLLGASGNLLISLVATGLVAVLFQPLRAVLQRRVNRLLYGQRDEPYAVITHLSQRLESTLAPDAVQLTADLQRSYEQLEQRVAERTRELSSLLDISHTVASTLQLKPLLGLILDQLKLVIDYTGSSILTVEGNSLVFLDHRGPVPQEQLVQLHFSLEHLGPIWETIASGESILIDDVYDELPLAQALRGTMGERLSTTFQYVCSWMAVPLMLRDRVIGMLVLASSEKRVFTQRHATLALAIANQAAIAIENARLYEQAQELAAIEERQKLARELHDSVSQALYGIALGLHTARIQLDRDLERLPESLDDLLSLAQAALAEMRALIFELRPESLEREGLVAALARQGAALQARHDMIVQTDLCEEPALPLMVKQELYRVAQEAMHNTVKHAQASKVDLVLHRTASVVILEVGDDGVGFDPLGSFPGHLGLRSMQERVSHLGGRLQIESAPGQGTHLLVQVPLGSRMADDVDGLPSA